MRKKLLILKKYGTCDILLSQFSYAAWKGGKKIFFGEKISAKENSKHLSYNQKF